MTTRVCWVVTGFLAIAVSAWAAGALQDYQKGQGQSARPHAEIGKPAPDFTLKDLEGKEHRLSDLKGKIVVLEWINHQCPFVRRTHTTKVQKNTLAKFKDKPVVWFAIDSSYFCADKADAIRGWAKEMKIDYPYLLDAAGKVGRAYGAKTTPHMFVIDKKGTLAYSGALDNNANGNEKNVRNYVEEAVSALLNGSTVATPTTKPYGCSVKFK